MKEIVQPLWQEILKEHGLADFEALWRLDLTLLDTPNTGRGKGGFSEVGLLSVPQPNGQVKKLIIKRQRDYLIRTLSHPFRGIPTLRNEALSTLDFNKLGIPAMKVVYYGEKREKDGLKAILLTEYLEGYTSLDRLCHTWDEQRQWPRAAERRKLIGSIADLISTMHAKKMRHNSLYPKHIFLRMDKDGFDCRLIDLEKVRWNPLGSGRIVRDLDSLHRHAPGWSKADRLRFFKSYCRINRLTSKEKRLCRRVLKGT
jgi:hypothetical protein